MSNTVDKLLKLMKTKAPSILFTVTSEHDYDCEQLWYAPDVEYVIVTVKASCIVNGEILEESDCIGGIDKQVHSDDYGTINDYADSLFVTAITNLRKLTTPLSFELTSQLDNALESIKTLSTDRLLDALKRARILLDIVTIGQVIDSDNKVITASGLNPWCVNEGASRNDKINLNWLDTIIKDFDYER